MDGAAKYVFVTGGVVSSSARASRRRRWARCSKARGLKVGVLKLDPYINVDPGTMSPYQHGEVFVTDDGAETDLDLGHYERFIDENTTRCRTSPPAGSTYSVICKERRGDYLGAHRPGDPAHHRRDQGRILRVGEASDADVVIVEIGGTVGDIEFLPFLEAIRQMRIEVGRENVMYVHVTLVPYRGRQRAEDQADAAQRERAAAHRHHARRPGLPHRDAVERRDERKIALFCRHRPARRHRGGRRRHLRVTAGLRRSGSRFVIERLGLDANTPALDQWSELVRPVDAPRAAPSDRDRRQVRGAPGRLYFGRRGAQARRHPQRHRVNIKWVDAETLNGPRPSSA